jgi:UDP:flavonoid glycosyltransferase YjiC (YdhE family)
MRVPLSTIGSRGDVQPVVALAVQLKAPGQMTSMPIVRSRVESAELSLVGEHVPYACCAQIRLHSGRSGRNPPKE